MEVFDYTIGVDIGASKLNIGLLNNKGQIICKNKTNIQSIRNYEQIADLCCHEVENLLNNAKIRMEQVGHIGMGVPGTVDADHKVIRCAPNLGWHDVNICDIISKKLGIEVKVEQDTRAAAIAEYLKGAGKGKKSIVCLTLGTGIGAGIIIDGQVFEGCYNTAGEIGHTIVEKNGRLCGCGKRGCLEAYASGTAIIKIAKETKKWDHITKAEDVFDKAKANDETAQKIISEAIENLGMSVVNLINILSPNVVIFSGGMCAQQELFINPVCEYVYKHAYNIVIEDKSFEIGPAKLGADAPMIGAGLLYKVMCGDLKS